MSLPYEAPLLLISFKYIKFRNKKSKLFKGVNKEPGVKNIIAVEVKKPKRQFAAASIVWETRYFDCLSL